MVLVVGVVVVVVGVVMLLLLLLLEMAFSRLLREGSTNRLCTSVRVLSNWT